MTWVTFEQASRFCAELGAGSGERVRLPTTEE